MKPLTLAEAAQFLRMSRSSLYQRKDIPRYRRPGSRVILFDQDELETWLKQGRIDSAEQNLINQTVKSESEVVAANSASILDFPSEPIYHRNALYR